MAGTENTVVLQGLDPLTQYGVEVFSVVEEESSEPLQGVETTRRFYTLDFLIHMLSLLHDAGLVSLIVIFFCLECHILSLTSPPECCEKYGRVQ